MARVIFSKCCMLQFLFAPQPCCLTCFLYSVLFIITDGKHFIYLFIQYLTVWGVEPDVTHQTSWLGSTGVCGVRQNQAGGSSAGKRVYCPVVGKQVIYKAAVLHAQRVCTWRRAEYEHTRSTCMHELLDVSFTSTVVNCIRASDTQTDVLQRHLSPKHLRHQLCRNRCRAPPAQTSVRTIFLGYLLWQIISGGPSQIVRCSLNKPPCCSLIILVCFFFITTLH